ncbi:MAG: DUF2461 domain-containing protein [Bacteroidaceae bacterium]|nr:DUF2461 domain-containing protein [Bacteroidaceae bacterium]
MTTISARRKVLQFLRDIKLNNNRPWFKAHRAVFDEAQAIFHDMAQELIDDIATFDAEVAGIEARSTTYRFYRDTRFSADKSPYKRHFGTFINTHGTKAFTMGYYYHIEPGASMIACGNYWHPTDALTAIRNDIVANPQLLLRIVEDARFQALFGQEIGMDCLKTVPKGFPKDFPHPELIRPRAYCVQMPLSDDKVLSSDWLEHVGEACRVAKPFMDYINQTLEDYI